MDRSVERPRRGGGGDSRDKNLNLVDVYDIAADIGKVRSQNSSFMYNIYYILCIVYCI